MSTPEKIFENEGEREDGAGAAVSDGIGTGVLLRRASGVLSTTPLEEGEYIAHGLWGHELAAKLADPIEREGLYLLDVRSRDAYDEGHIDGAHHVTFSDWASPDNLQKLPRDKKIIVICETGLAAAQVVAGLRMLGYDAAVPKTGINGWSRSSATDLLIEEIGMAKYPVMRVPPEAGHDTAAAAILLDNPDDDEYELIASRARTVFADLAPVNGLPKNVVTAPELYELLQDEAGRDDIFLIDLRREEDYEGVGHIEGSLRMDFDAAVSPGNLERLPRDKKIVTVCYTGNLAAQLAVVLRLLGYDADALAYGMVSWTRTPTTYLYLKDIQKADNPLV